MSTKSYHASRPLDEGLSGSQEPCGGPRATSCLCQGQLRASLRVHCRQTLLEQQLLPGVVSAPDATRRCCWPGAHPVSVSHRSLYTPVEAEVKWMRWARRQPHSPPDPAEVLVTDLTSRSQYASSSLEGDMGLCTPLWSPVQKHLHVQLFSGAVCISGGHMAEWEAVESTGFLLFCYYIFAVQLLAASSALRVRVPPLQSEDNGVRPQMATKAVRKLKQDMTPFRLLDTHLWSACSVSGHRSRQRGGLTL